MRILVIEDEKNIADTLALILERAGHEVTAAYDGTAALKIADSLVPQCVISDVILPGVNGMEICAVISAKYPRCHILLSSGQAETKKLLEDAQASSYNWELLTKPVEPHELLERLVLLEATLQDSNAPESNRSK